MRFFVPLRTPSLNHFAKAHWRVLDRLKRQWFQQIYACRRLAEGPGFVNAPLYRRARVHIERWTARPIKDVDNLYGSVKPVLDALVKDQVLVDDSAAHVELVIEQKKCPREAEGTWITVTPLDGPA